MEESRQNPMVSVILTSYNHEKYIGQSIESILRQSYVDYELIIVDDGSSDDSWDIIQKYQAKDARIRSVQNLPGVVHVLNEPIRTLARGKYIAVHHSDDMWEPDKLEHQVAFLEENPMYGAVFTWVRVINEEGGDFTEASHFYAKIFEQPNRSRQEWLNYFFYRGNALCHPSVLIRKECYERIGLFEHSFVKLGDFLMWIKLCLQYEIYVLPKRLVRFRVRAGEANASGDNPENRVKSKTELFFLLDHYTAIKDPLEFAAVFPQQAKLALQDGFSIEYSMARLCLDERLNNVYHFWGISRLYRLMMEETKRKQLENAYGFTYRNFLSISGRYDVISNHQLVYQSSLYIDEGDGFCETNKLVEAAKHTGWNRYEVSFALRGGPQLRRLRFDPIEGVASVCRLHSLKTDGVIIETQANEDWKNEAGEYFFGGTDPAFVFCGDFSAAKFLRIDYSIRSLSSEEILKWRESERKTVEKEREKLDKEREALAEERALAQNLVNEIKQSKAYKIICFLRRFKIQKRKR